MNQFRALCSEEPNEPPREFNIQPTSDQLKPRTYPTETSNVVSDIMGILNHHDIDNGDVQVCPSQFQVESNSESDSDPATNMIKSIDDDEMNNIMEFFYSEHDDDLMGVDLQMLQA